MRAAADESRELPVVDMGHSVDEFYHDLEKKTKAGKTLPVWRGELYLEVSGYHLSDEEFMLTLHTVPSWHVHFSW